MGAKVANILGLVNEIQPLERSIKKKQEHIHMYKRWRQRPKYYRCIHPDCSHYTLRSLLIGKRALCPRCGNPFIMTWKQLELAFPHCDDCTAGKSRSKKVELESSLKEFFKEK